VDTARYREWKKIKCQSYPQNVEKLQVKIGSLVDLSDAETAEIKRVCRHSNMAIYTCSDAFADRAAICTFASRFGLTRLDHHLCANADGVSELSVALDDSRSGYVPYSNRSLSWHTDGYYNERTRQIRAVVLHCVNDAAAGGENALLDPEIAYIRLRDEDPRFIAAFEHPECMTIPANVGQEGAIVPAKEISNGVMMK
jgi:alpha-ketoglutarate-dependent taurine dioxygenase